MSTDDLVAKIVARALAPIKQLVKDIEHKLTLIEATDEAWRTGRLLSNGHLRGHNDRDSRKY